jgi:hypothetical protein
VLQWRHDDTLPTLFLSHGSPMTALEPGAAGAFLQRLGPAIDAAFGRPKAVLAISAHTLAREPVLLAAPRHEAVYDFGGFPDALYRCATTPPARPRWRRGAAAAGRRRHRHVHRVDEGGLDHGIWTPLRYAYPEADVPVLPLGFVPTWTPERSCWPSARRWRRWPRGRAGRRQRQHHAQPAHGVRRRPAAGGRTRGRRERRLPRLGGRPRRAPTGRR